MIDIQDQDGHVIFAVDADALTFANLRGANLGDADLTGANLGGADLAGADLTFANLRGANLFGANLCGANLRDANLRGTDLTGANLGGANLRGADLTGADLTGANLGDADLTGATYGAATMTRGVLQILGGEFPVYIFDSHIKIGCKLYPTQYWACITDKELGPNYFPRWEKYKDVILSLAKHHQG
jgi:hypothetical protein